MYAAITPVGTMTTKGQNKDMNKEQKDALKELAKRLGIVLVVGLCVIALTSGYPLGDAIFGIILVVCVIYCIYAGFKTWKSNQGVLIYSVEEREEAEKYITKTREKMTVSSIIFNVGLVLFMVYYDNKPINDPDIWANEQTEKANETDSTTYKHYEFDNRTQYDKLIEAIDLMIKNVPDEE